MTKNGNVRLAHYIGHLRDQYHWHKTETPGFVIGHIEGVEEHNHTIDPPIERGSTSNS